jgi:hypothetical protein
MTKAQSSLYWRTWSKVRKVLIDFGGYSKEDADAERHEIHRQALGNDKSSTALTNRDLDAILDHFQSYLVLADGPSTGPSRAASQPVSRLIWAISQTGLPEPYLESIARDQFGTSEWRKLDEHQLAKLRFTAVSRAAARRKAERQTKTA